MENYRFILGHVTYNTFSPAQLSILISAKIIISPTSLSLLPVINFQIIISDNINIFFD